MQRTQFVLYYYREQFKMEIIHDIYKYVHHVMSEAYHLMGWEACANNVAKLGLWMHCLFPMMEMPW